MDTRTRALLLKASDELLRVTNERNALLDRVKELESNPSSNPRIKTSDDVDRAVFKSIKELVLYCHSKSNLTVPEVYQSIFNSFADYYGAQRPDPDLFGASGFKSAFRRRQAVNG